MKTLSTKGNKNGLTLIELLVVITIVVVLAALLLPSLHPGHRKSHLIQCVNQMRQLQLGLLMFAGDYGDRFPAQVPVVDGGSMEFIQTDHAFLHFEKLCAYAGGTNLYRMLVCPGDRNRQVATNLQALNDLALSYFMNVDASPTNKPAQTIVIGERNLQLNRLPVKPGLLSVTLKSDLDWTEEVHAKRGNLGFADGHVQVSRGEQLKYLIQQQPAATNRFAVP